MISKITPDYDGRGYSDEQYNDVGETVIIKKEEAQALLTFIQDQWLNRDIEHLDDAVKRLKVSLE